MGWKAETPLAKTLQLLGVTQKSLAVRLGVDQAQVSLICRRVKTPAMAERVLSAIDPSRAILNELHLIWPERYPDFMPVAPDGFELPHHPAQAPETAPAAQGPQSPSGS